MSLGIADWGLRTADFSDCGLAIVDCAESVTIASHQSQSAIDSHQSCNRQFSIQQSAFSNSPVSNYQVLARKWRPQRFDDVIGQRGVTQTLRNAIAAKRIAQSFVFAGPRGVGKTTTARILARALNCEKGPTADPCGICDACVEIAQGRDIDVLEIDAATHTQVDKVREVIIDGLGDRAGARTATRSSSSTRCTGSRRSRSTRCSSRSRSRRRTSSS